jgi:uncharacterized protein (TIGR00255 family)
MNSMTGYGWAEFQNEDISVTTEIKAYNNRFLDVTVNMPSFLSPLAPRVREYISAHCKRGSVEVWIRCKEYKSSVAVSVNREAARAYYEAASGIAGELGIPGKPALSDILGREGVLDIELSRDVERAYGYIQPVLEKAAALFEEERRREGEHTRADILNHLSILEKSLDIVSSYSGTLDETLKNNVKLRFEELLGNGVDENRVLAETAALLIKYTISEELSRLQSHLAEFRRAAGDADGAVSGKKLDFLCQEINREINTIGSKAALLEVSREVVNMKNALENIREQLRNVE